MKKTNFPWLAVLLAGAVLLTACSASKTSSSSAAAGGAPSGNSNQPLALAGQLAVGTLKLEGTPNAVDAKEAAGLLPLWQAYSQIVTSDSTAQAEIDGLVTQIKDTMTPAQVSAITAMKLTQQDTFTTLGKLGFASSGANAPSATGTPRASSNAGGGFAGGAGGPPGGSPGGGAGAPPAGAFGGGDLAGGGLAGAGTGQTSSTQVAPSSTRAGGIPPALLQSLIDFLQKRSQS